LSQGIASGAGARWAPALLFLALLALGAGGGRAAPRLPGEAVGEIPFVGNAGLFLDSEGREELYFCLAVPQAALRCDTLEGRAGEWARVRVELSGLDGAGEPLHTRRQKLDLPCAPGGDASAGLRRLVHLRAPWPAVSLDLEIRVMDEHAVRTGLIYQLRGEERRGILRGDLERPPLSTDRGLSSCIFLSDFQPEGFERRGRFRIAVADTARERVEPNPACGYGLLRETLLAYVEVYGFGGRGFDVRTKVRSLADGKTVLSDHADLEVPWQRSGVIYDADVAGLLAGTYDFEIELRPRDAGSGILSTHAHFQMIWRPESWGESQAELIEEMGLLIDPESLDRFRLLEPGAREAFMESLWADVDGFSLPGTWNGPARTLFAERVATADARFGTSLKRGSQSDRGRVFVRYGDPDEIQKELLPLERDQIANFMEREVGDAGRLESGGILRPNRMDASAYEVWYYVYRGDPLIPGAEPPGGGRSLKFIFADPLGNGQYRLIYSNLYGGMR